MFQFRVWLKTNVVLRYSGVICIARVNSVVASFFFCPRLLMLLEGVHAVFSIKETDVSVTLMMLALKPVSCGNTHMKQGQSVVRK